jgi:hypothetical protein
MSIAAKEIRNRNSGDAAMDSRNGIAINRAHQRDRRFTTPNRMK